MLTWSEVIKLADSGKLKPDRRVIKTADEWKTELTEEVFQITRLKQTERPHSSDMCSSVEPGLYACACCDSLLFDANEKFESGSGWPSFTQPVKENAVAYNKDSSFGMIRVETVCNTCDAHLGHVFEDGPGPGGLRFCINALSLKKVNEK
jgi:methionine-R-sulfoxide reductase